METKADFLKVDKEDIKILSDLFSPQIYQVQTQIIYKGQTPNAANLILSGSIDILQNKKTILTLGAETLLGLNTIMNNLPFRYTAQINPQTEVIILDRSAIKKIQELSLENVFKSLWL